MLLCLKPSQGPPSYSEKGPGSCRSWDPVPSPLSVPLWPRHPPPPRAALFLASSGFSRSSRLSPAWGFGASGALPLLLRTPFLRLSAWLTLFTVRSLFKCPLLNGTNCPRSGGLQASLPSTSAHGATHLPPFLCHLLITFVCDSSSPSECKLQTRRDLSVLSTDKSRVSGTRWSRAIAEARRARAESTRDFQLASQCWAMLQPVLM